MQRSGARQNCGSRNLLRYRQGKRLIVGTGAYGALPVMDEVLAEAKRRGIELIAAPTAEVCQLLEEVKKGQTYAILHCTC